MQKKIDIYEEIALPHRILVRPFKTFEQIKEKQYEAGLKEKGISKIYKIGIAFKGKNVKVKYEI